MDQPRLRFRPLRPAVAADRPGRLDLLLTITSPDLPAESRQRPRPPLNLALVIDRSGSMAGRKLSHARKAARFLAQQLTGRDRLAIVSFDDEVTVNVPSSPAGNPQPFLEAINRIHSGGSTALFDGWLEGAKQVAAHLDPAALNRVLLLSDGQANLGLTDARRSPPRWAASPSGGDAPASFGLGDGFDEDLMGAIAGAGDGTPGLPRQPRSSGGSLRLELQGLATTLGRRVSLGVRPKNGAGELDELNDLPLTDYGNHQLPNLSAPSGIHVACGCSCPPGYRTRKSPVCAWPGMPRPRGPPQGDRAPAAAGAPGCGSGGVARGSRGGRAAGGAGGHRARRQRSRPLIRCDFEAAASTLQSSRSLLAAMPSSALLRKEIDLLNEKQGQLERDRNRFPQVAADGIAALQHRGVGGQN